MDELIIDRRPEGVIEGTGGRVYQEWTCTWTLLRPGLSPVHGGRQVGQRLTIWEAIEQGAQWALTHKEW